MKQKTYQLMIEEVPVTVTKKKMKHMYLRIKKEDGSVLISAPYEMSEERIYRFASERLDWIRTHREKYLRAAKEREQARQPGPAELKREKERFRQEAERLVKKWEPVMGVSVSGITVRRMKTRWGSCNVNTHHINLNLALAQKPPECLEYVVVHELAHLLEPGHNPVFWGYMTQFYPDWKRVRKYLNDEL